MDWKITSINTANHEVSITFEDGEVIDTVIPMTHKTTELKQQHIKDTASKHLRRRHFNKASKILKRVVPYLAVILVIYLFSRHGHV